MVIDKINKIFDEAKNDKEEFEESYQSLKKPKMENSDRKEKKSDYRRRSIPITRATETENCPTASTATPTTAPTATDGGPCHYKSTGTTKHHFLKPRSRRNGF